MKFSIIATPLPNSRTQIRKMIKRFFTAFSLGILSLLVSCSTSPKLVNTTYSTNVITHGDDTQADSLISPYKKSMDKEMNTVLGYSETAMVKGTPEGVLGNFVADLVLSETNKRFRSATGGADICMLNNGGLRSTLPEGEITRGKVFELMPFENEVVILTLSGKQTKKMFDYIARIGGVPLSGAKLGINKKKPVNVTIGGQPLDTSRSYKIVTSDYLAAGGDKMNFFNDPLQKENTGLKLRDAIIYYITDQNIKGQKLSSKIDGRITNEE